ncbi:hypothetical protein NKG94_25040 [Micromonospora sp. M12]
MVQNGGWLVSKDGKQPTADTRRTSPPSSTSRPCSAPASPSTRSSSTPAGPVRRSARARP